MCNITFHEVTCSTFVLSLSPQVKVRHLQVDNQLAATTMPVLLVPKEASGVAADSDAVKLTVVMERAAGEDEHKFQYVVLQVRGRELASSRVTEHSGAIEPTVIMEISTNCLEISTHFLPAAP